MKKEKTNKILIIYVLMILILSSMIFSTSTVNASINYSSGFEDGTLTQQYSNSWFVTSSEYGNFMVNNTEVRSGSKGFGMNNNSAGWWNYTYSTDSMLLDWYVYTYYKDQGATDTDMYFNFSNSTGTNLIQFKIVHADNNYHHVYYFSATGGWVKLGGNHAEENWYRFGFSYTSSDVVNYTYGSSMADDAPAVVSDNPRITSLYIVGSYYSIGGWAGTFNFDDMSISLYNSFVVPDSDITPSNENSYYDVLNYTQICSASNIIANTSEGQVGISAYTDYSFNLDNNYVEMKYNRKIDGVIRYIDLYVDLGQYLLYSGNNDVIQLVLSDGTGSSGTVLGAPDTYFDVSGSTQKYILRWEITNGYSLSSEPVFEFYGQSIGIFSFWSYGRFIKNSYNSFSAITHDSSSLYSDAVFNNLEGEYLDDNPEVKLDMCFYYQQIELADPYDTTGYTINSDKSNYLTGENTYLSYTTPDLPSTIEIYKDSVKYGDTKTLNKEAGTVSEFLYESGSYEARLIRSTIIKDRCYFNVTGSTNNIGIWTEPNPSLPYRNFMVKWRYNLTDDGVIYYSIDEDDFENSHMLSRIQSDSGNLVTGFDILDAEDTATYYIYLCQLNGTVAYRLKTHTHKVLSGSSGYSLRVSWHEIIPQRPEGRKGGVTENTIIIIKDSMTKEDGWYFVIEGTQPLLGGDVWILVNDEKFQYVGGSATYKIHELDRFRDERVYTVSLVYYVNDSEYYTVWDSVSFTVWWEAGSHKDDSILPDLGVTLGAIVGLIVTMFCTLSPLLVTKGLKAKHSVPSIVYAFTCCLGISVSVLLGFFPFWIIPFIVIVGIIILLIQYIINGGGSKGD